MMTVDSAQANDHPLLSICIPTYNRANCLDNCLASLERATRDCAKHIEIVVSDNASTDRTAEIVHTWRSRLPIRYIRNAVNIGGERNFFSAAGHAAAEYVWVFGDDDDFGETAVTEVLRYIGSGYDLIVANYGSWSKNMDTVIASPALSLQFRPEYHDPNLILSTFGILMGYISSVVVRKSILLSVPSSEYEPFVPYGFPFPYSIYCGLLRQSRMAYIPKPLFRRREYNSDFVGAGAHTMWVKFFIEGPALVFEALERKGYNHAAVLQAKDGNLRDFGFANVISGVDRIDRMAVLRMMYRHYRASWRLWFVWVPGLLMPPPITIRLLRLYRWLRNRKEPLEHLPPERA